MEYTEFIIDYTQLSYGHKIISLFLSNVIFRVRARFRVRVVRIKDSVMVGMTFRVRVMGKNISIVSII